MRVAPRTTTRPLVAADNHLRRPVRLNSSDRHHHNDSRTRNDAEDKLLFPMPPCLPLVLPQLPRLRAPAAATGAFARFPPSGRALAEPKGCMPSNGRTFPCLSSRAGVRSRCRVGCSAKSAARRTRGVADAARAHPCFLKVMTRVLLFPQTPPFPKTRFYYHSSAYDRGRRPTIYVKTRSAAYARTHDH